MNIEESEEADERLTTDRLGLEVSVLLGLVDHKSVLVLVEMTLKDCKRK